MHCQGMQRWACMCPAGKACLLVLVVIGVLQARGVRQGGVGKRASHPINQSKQVGGRPIAASVGAALIAGSAERHVPLACWPRQLHCSPQAGRKAGQPAWPQCQLQATHRAAGPAAAAAVAGKAAAPPHLGHLIHHALHMLPVHALHACTGKASATSLAQLQHYPCQPDPPVYSLCLHAHMRPSADHASP